MRLAGFDMNLLLVLEALAREGSVTGAARRLGLGQSATSAALARLRAAFGDELFIRTPEGMRPTPRAAELLPGVSAILAEARRTLEAGATFVPREASRRFVLASSDYTSAVLLPRLVAFLSAEAPGVELRVIGYDKDDVPTLLARGEIDAAIGVFPSPPEGAVVTPLYTDSFTGLARAGHPALQGGGIDLDAFCAWPHALVTTRRDAAGAVDAALAELGRHRRIAVTVPQMLALPAVLATSDLLAAVPARLPALIAASGLRGFVLPVRPPSWAVVMLWPAVMRGDQGGAWFRRAIRDIAGGRVQDAAATPA
jgi:DNA-binding transcriptional LysR family regulator